MKAPDSFTSYQPRTCRPPHAATRFQLGGVLAITIAFSYLAAGSTAAWADEGRLRGDLPPIAGHAPSAEFEALSESEAKALFQRVHALLSDLAEGRSDQARALYLGAIQGMLSQIEGERREQPNQHKPTSSAPGMLLSTSQAQRIRETLAGQVTGIGIEFLFLSERGVLRVSRVLPGSPAEASGLQEHDQILAIDGQPFAGASLTEVLTLLQGESNQTVTFEFLRSGHAGFGRYVIQIKRAAFSVQSSDGHLETSDIGYLQLHQLHRRTPAEIEASLGEFEQQGATRFILDLRGCVGGELEAARAIADLFLPKDTVIAVTTEPGRGSEDLRAKAPQRFTQTLAILIDRWTRGSAELLVASLQEQNRAFVIGEPSRGRARSETLIDLGHSLVLRLESIRLSGAMGESWADDGVQPDQPIWPSSSKGAQSAGRAADLQFQTAVHYLTHDADQ